MKAIVWMYLCRRLRQTQSSLIYNVDAARTLSRAATCKHLTGIRGEKQTDTTETSGEEARSGGSDGGSVGESEERFM